MEYTLAERFKSLQGEGLYAGTPMAFARTVGCSVGKKVCHGCDTDFEAPLLWKRGGTYTAREILDWALPYEHLCLTGGEPFDQDLWPILHEASTSHLRMIHIETSGTRPIANELLWAVRNARRHVWLTVSPKPGFLEDSIKAADEVKVIVPGLGSGPGWPSLTDALRWAKDGKLVFLQPRNEKATLNVPNLQLVLGLIAENPTLRLSNQAHKAWGLQ